MFSLLYYLGILTQGYGIVNRILQEKFNIFCKILLLLQPDSDFLLPVEFGEGTLVRAVHQTVKHSGHQTANNEHRPDQPVIAACCDQQEADQILGQGREDGIDHAGDAAHSAAM